jgi:hypothetical protein
MRVAIDEYKQLHPRAVASETKSEDTVENDLYADDLDNNGHNNDICFDNNG